MPVLVPFSSIPSGGAWGYEATSDPEVDQTTHELERVEPIPPGTFVKSAVVTATDAATVTFDLSAGNKQRVILGGSRTFALLHDDLNPAFTTIVGWAGDDYTPTWWAGIRWATDDGLPPTPTAIAGQEDVYSFFRLGPGEYLGFIVAQGIAALPTAPVAPTIGTATGGNAQATVTHTVVSTGGTPITAVVVTPYIAGVAQSPQTFIDAATTHDVTGLTNGTAYTFKVALTNAIGTSSQSAATNPATPTASFSPGDFGSRLKVYLEGDDLSVGAVAAWGSRSPATFDASQATGGNRPVAVASVLNGHTIVRFTAASSHYLTLGTAEIISETAGKSYTVFAVTKMPATGSVQMLLSRDHDTLGRDFDLDKNTGNLEIRVAGTEYPVGASSDDFEYWTFESTAGGLRRILVNGTQVASDTNAALGSAATGETDIGRWAYSGGGLYAGMDLAALYCVTPKCSGGELTSMHAYIADRFAL